MKISLIDENLGQCLANHRKSLNLSQEYLAEMLQRDQTYISKVETGKRQLTVADFLRWSKALNLTSDDMIEILNLSKQTHE